jgi:hypothetical protein
MLRVTVNTGDLSGKLDRLPDVVKDALVGEVTLLTELLYGAVKEKAGGDVLKVITGTYLESFQEKVKVNPKSVVGQVFTKDPRAGVLEWGGHTPPRVIAAKNVRALHFLATSGELFAAVVHHPGANIKPHSVLNATLQEQKDDIQARLTAAGTMAASGAIDQSEAGND